MSVRVRVKNKKRQRNSESLNGIRLTEVTAVRSTCMYVHVILCAVLSSSVSRLSQPWSEVWFLLKFFHQFTSRKGSVALNYGRLEFSKPTDKAKFNMSDIATARVQNTARYLRDDHLPFLHVNRGATARTGLKSQSMKQQPKQVNICEAHSFMDCHHQRMFTPL